MEELQEVKPTIKAIKTESIMDATEKIESRVEKGNWSIGGSSGVPEVITNGVEVGQIIPFDVIVINTNPILIEISTDTYQILVVQIECIAVVEDRQYKVNVGVEYKQYLKNPIKETTKVKTVLNEGKKGKFYLTLVQDFLPNKTRAKTTTKPKK